MRLSFLLAAVLVVFSAFLIGCSNEDPVKVAENLIEKGEYRKAIRFLRETTREVSPFEQDELNILLATAYIRIRKYGKAKDILFSITPQNDNLKKKLAIALLELGDSARSIGYRKMAKESYEIALLNDPHLKLGKRYLLLINESYRLGDCDLVIKFSSRYINETHDTTKIFSKYVDCLYQVGDWQTIDSLESYFIAHNRIKDMGWALGEALYNIAVNKLGENRLEEAKKTLLRLVNKVRSPKILMDDAYFLLAGIYEELQYPDSALDMYYKCMETSLTQRSPLYKESVVKVQELKHEMGVY